MSTARSTSQRVAIILVVGLLATSTPAPSASAGATALDVAVGASSDDAEEATGGAVSSSSSDLELVNDGTDQTVGLRFAGLQIPPGAAVVVAYVQFEVDEVSTATTSLLVRGQAADTAPTFTKTTGNVSTRARTNAFVAWNPPPWPTIQVAGPDQRTPDLSPIVQEIVNRQGWVSGNALALIITGNGRRTAEAFDGTRAPVLHVEYTGGAPTNRPPSVSAGPDQLITLPDHATVSGQVADDGLPSTGSLTQRWTQVSGAGTATFGDASSLVTDVSFDLPGTYGLRLTASDSELTATDDVIVTVYLPAATVSEVHYSFTGPASVAFDWRGGPGDLRYGLTDAYGTTVQASAPNPMPFSAGGPFWEATVTGLSPATVYHYSISGGADATFSTAPVGGVRFDAAGDIGSSLKGSRVTTSMNQIATDSPSFVLALGDLTYANNDGQPAVDRHFDDVMAWSRAAAYMPAWGNHDWGAPDDLRNYKGRFALPNAHASVGAPAAGCCGEDWGWFDAGGARFISYPEPFSSTTWTEWRSAVDPIMAAAQADPSLHYIVTYGHRPAYSTGRHSGDGGLAGVLDGLGDTYSKYVVNLNGHSHDYERYQPIHHVTHITAGGGGASLETPWTSTDPRTVFRAMHLHHLRVDVTATTMQIDAVCGPATTGDDLACAPGSVIDSVTIAAPSSFNRAPTVDAGADQQAVLPYAATVSGRVSDDGLPSPTSLAQRWTQISGPGTATFLDASSPVTGVTFDVAGTYGLRLTASDSELTGSDDVTVTAVAAGAAIFEKAVATSSDDAEEAASGAVSLTSSDLELVTDGSVVQTVGIRFTGVTVPRGATITNAYIQFEVDEISTGAASLTVRGQAADNPATFAKTTGNLSTRPRTTESVAWSPAPWATIQVAGVDQRTPDLAPIVRELVATSGWVPGQAMVLLVTGSGRRTAEAIDGTRAPVLHIEYVVP